MALSSTLKGSVRQLTACQDLFKIAGAVLFVPLLYIEVFGRVPLVYALVRHASTRVDRQMAFVFLLFNLTMAILFSLMTPFICRLLEWATPADGREDHSKLQYLYDEALEEPVTALDLIEKEQLRLAKRLRMQAAALRTGSGSPERTNASLLHEPFKSVAAQIDRFQHELLNQQLGAQGVERLTKLQTRLSLIVYLEDSLRALGVATAAVPIDGRLGDFVLTFVEALDFVLLEMIGTVESGDRSSLELLMRITEDRGDLMERIRQEYLAEESSIATADRAVLLQVTSVFERVIWMVHRFARLIEPVPDGVAVGASDATIGGPTGEPSMAVGDADSEKTSTVFYST
jgi:phosphate:Na+ symporter